MACPGYLRIAHQSKPQKLAREQTIEWTKVVAHLKNGIEIKDYAMYNGLLFNVLDCQGGYLLGFVRAHVMA